MGTGDVLALASALDEVIIDLDDCEVRARVERAKRNRLSPRPDPGWLAS